MCMNEEDQQDCECGGGREEGRGGGEGREG